MWISRLKVESVQRSDTCSCSMHGFSHSLVIFGAKTCLSLLTLNALWIIWAFIPITIALLFVGSMVLFGIRQVARILGQRNLANTSRNTAFRCTTSEWSELDAR